jgi:hypothetical protein
MLADAESRAAELEQRIAILRQVEADLVDQVGEKMLASR